MKVTRPMPHNPVISRQADRWRTEMNEVTRHWLVNTLGGNHQPRSQGPLLLGPRVGEDPGNEVG